MTDYAKLILESILKEDAMQNNVIDAIKKRYEVEITYNDDAKGSRIIQPVAYGKTKSGNLVVRAYQSFGDSERKSAPSWGFFRLDRITSWKPNKSKKFNKPPHYNPNGDKTMSDVYVVAKFNGMKNDALIRHNKKVHDQKVAENPYYDLQRNIKRSFDGNKVDYIAKNVADWQNSEAKKEFMKGNGQSVYDMSRITDFGDNDIEQTTGPVRKNNLDTGNKPQEKQNSNNYSQAMNNGPVYKKQAPDFKYVDDEPEETDDEKLTNDGSK